MSGKYRTIVADPPWYVKTGPSWGTPATGPNNTSSHALKYPTMFLGEIQELPVDRLAANDAHLYLWTINAYVEAAYDVARKSSGGLPQHAVEPRAR